MPTARLPDNCDLGVLLDAMNGADIGDPPTGRRHEFEAAVTKGKICWCIADVAMKCREFTVPAIFARKGEDAASHPTRSDSLSTGAAALQP